MMQTLETPDVKFAPRSAAAMVPLEIVEGLVHGALRHLTHQSSIASAMRRREHSVNGNLEGRAVITQREEIAETSPSAMSDSDRRRHPRRLSCCQVSVLQAGTERVSTVNIAWAFRSTSIRGQMLDVSIGGVSFAASDKFASGSRLYVEIKHPRRVSPVIRSVVVTKCFPLDEEWKVLCRFETPLSFDEVTQLSLCPTC